ncbi:EmrB/QacA subfamily drug resistance transporter [Curtobacterium luteum]|uniref:EmrB/QacA subfamily drug resistance transporter n=1 Tax=Curtobacterium luteum TaxID=33881 RepID=A0A8H9G8G9_9MICO|nr:MDR family MFS transporter [Curtobacterium luteum]MBM7803230.1 EmrB/QacA subfamily drug resistance transporter [Curtobacterium luteum]NUU50878.1 MFS transporter [Curtobacterium luteum]GGK95070.1 MFS transporter [Curtobacterium luteum]
MAARSGGVGLRSERGPILLSLMLATALVALDSTIIATASTSIARDLGHFQQLPWLFSVYLLAQAVSVPIYGRLADVLGRKRLLLVGIGLFLLGSVLCGAAWSMPVLIAGRVVQGLGAGAVLPISMTITSDIYTLEERAKTQGYLASVWGVASVVGPTLGGVFSELGAWRWIFWINIPLALVAGFMLVRAYTEQRSADGPRQRIDLPGAVLLTLGTTALLLGLLEGGTTWAWGSGASIGIFVAAALFLTAFLVVELRTAHPIFSLALLRRRVVAASTVASLVIGVIVMGLSTYVPIYAQDVLGTSALVAGFALAALTLGWPISASQAGRFYLRWGFRVTALIGSTLVMLGAALTITLGSGSSVWWVAVFCFVVGAGMGLTAVPTLIAAQSSAAHDERGAVTGTNMFARSMGSAIGVAVFGAVVNAHVRLGASGSPEGPGLMTAMHLVFVSIAVIALVLLVAVSFMPAHRRRAEAPAAAEAATA